MAVRTRKAASMAVRAAWFSSVMLETMPIRSGTEEGTWSDMLKASEWGRAGVCKRQKCLGHVMTRLLESRRRPVIR